MLGGTAILPSDDGSPDMGDKGDDSGIASWVGHDGPSEHRLQGVSRAQVAPQTIEGWTAPIHVVSIHNWAGSPRTLRQFFIVHDRPAGRDQLGTCDGGITVSPEVAG